MLRFKPVLHFSSLSDVGLGFFFCDSHLFSCRTQVVGAGLGFHPRPGHESISLVSIQVLCCTCLSDEIEGFSNSGITFLYCAPERSWKTSIQHHVLWDV